MSKNCNQFTFAVDKAMTTPTLNGKLKTIKFADRKIQNLHTHTEKLRDAYYFKRGRVVSFPQLFPGFPSAGASVDRQLFVLLSAVFTTEFQLQPNARNLLACHFICPL